MFIEILRKVLESDRLSLNNFDSLFNESYKELYSGSNKFYVDEDPFLDLEINLFLREDYQNEFRKKLSYVSKKRQELIESTSKDAPFPNYNSLNNYLKSYYNLLVYVVKCYQSGEVFELLSKEGLESLLFLENDNGKLLFNSPQFLMLYKICFDKIPQYLELIKANPDKKEYYINAFISRVKNIDFSLVSINKRLYSCKLSANNLCLDTIPYNIGEIDTSLIISEMIDKIEQKVLNSHSSLDVLNIIILGNFDYNDIDLLSRFLKYLSLKYKTNLKVNLTVSYLYDEEELIYDSEVLKITKRPYNGELSTPKKIEELGNNYDMLFILNFFDLYRIDYMELGDYSAYMQQIKDFYTDKATSIENAYLVKNSRLNSMTNFLVTSVVNENGAIFKNQQEIPTRALKKSQVNYVTSYFEKAETPCSLFLYDSLVGTKVNAMRSNQSKILLEGRNITLTDTCIKSTIFNSNVEDTYAIEFNLFDIYLLFKDIISFNDEILKRPDIMLNTKFYLVYDRFFKDGGKVPKIIYSINNLNQRDECLVQEFIYKKFYPLFSTTIGDELSNVIKSRFVQLFYRNAHTISDITFLGISRVSDYKSANLSFSNVFRGLKIQNDSYKSKNCNPQHYADRFLLYKFLFDCASKPSPNSILDFYHLKYYGWNLNDLFDEVIEVCNRLKCEGSPLHSNILRLKDR